MRVRHVQNFFKSETDLIRRKEELPADKGLPIMKMDAVKFDYTWMGAILGVVILVIVLLLDVEKYADQYNKN